MKLYFNPASPYVRKVMITAIETGLDGRIQQIPTAVTPVKPNPDVAKDNPLMKVPTLVTDDGFALYDSRVICEYLDSQHAGTPLIPRSGPDRWRARRWEAMADGITDAGLLCRYETIVRPEDKRSEEWTRGQMTKVIQGLDMAEHDSALLTGPINLGQIALACSIGWLEFRDVAGDIRKTRPKLASWYERFSSRPSMQATKPFQM
ncbi:MAG: glutathione S-transferase [Alphaproteobacteria bacterium]|nr:glutathione S-transferase [Alphaproteobacteria bacterium]